MTPIVSVAGKHSQRSRNVRALYYCPKEASISTWVRSLHLEHNGNIPWHSGQVRLLYYWPNEMSISVISLSMIELLRGNVIEYLCQWEWNGREEKRHIHDMHHMLRCRLSNLLEMSRPSLMSAFIATCSWSYPCACRWSISWFWRHSSKACRRPDISSSCSAISFLNSMTVCSSSEIRIACVRRFLIGPLLRLRDLARGSPIAFQWAFTASVRLQDLRFLWQ